MGGLPDRPPLQRNFRIDAFAGAVAEDGALEPIYLAEISKLTAENDVLTSETLSLIALLCIQDTRRKLHFR